MKKILIILMIITLTGCKENNYRYKIEEINNSPLYDFVPFEKVDQDLLFKYVTIDDDDDDFERHKGIGLYGKDGIIWTSVQHTWFEDDVDTLNGHVRDILYNDSSIYIFFEVFSSDNSSLSVVKMSLSGEVEATYTLKLDKVHEKENGFFIDQSNIVIVYKSRANMTDTYHYLTLDDKLNYVDEETHDSYGIELKEITDNTLNQNYSYLCKDNPSCAVNLVVIFDEYNIVVTIGSNLETIVYSVSK